MTGGQFNLHSLAVLLGWMFMIYTATQETYHMPGLKEMKHEEKKLLRLKQAKAAA